MAEEVVPVPVYLPDRTQVGTAVVNVEDGTALISIQGDSGLMALFRADVAGISIMYMDRNRAEEIQNKQGEKTDGTN